MAAIPPSEHAPGKPSAERKTEDSTGDPRFRLEAAFQRSSEPLFVLSRRRLVFINKAFEALVGLPASDLLGQVCSRRLPDGPGIISTITRALAPPSEALRGSYFRTMKTLPGPGSLIRLWDIEYFPLRAGLNPADALTEVAGQPFSAVGAATGEVQKAPLIIGKISVARSTLGPKVVPLSDKLNSLRDRVAHRYRLDQLTSAVPAMQRVVDQVGLACQASMSVLLQGEPGAGKTWIARTIHFQGPDRAGPFVSIDCGHLPVDLVSSLLGGDKGILARLGPGTLYLRDPERLPRELQSNLWDWLQDKNSKGMRLIAASSGDLQKEIDAGRLLPELHARMGTLIIQVPALRDRPADLDKLIHVMGSRFQDADAGTPRRFSSDAKAALLGYTWHGNLRELSEVLAGTFRHAKGETLELTDLPAYLRLLVRMDQTPAPDAERSLPLDQILGKVEQRLIQVALRLAKGNKTKAAELLAIPRPRLWRRLEGSE